MKGIGCLALFGLLLTGCVKQETQPPATLRPEGEYAKALAQAEKDGFVIHAAQLQKPLPPESENAAPLYVELTRLLKEKSLEAEDEFIGEWAKHEFPFRGERKVALQRALISRSDALALVHQAVQRPKCVFTRSWAQDDPSWITFPEFPAMRAGMRMLVSESLLMASEGRTEAAIRNLAHGFIMAEHAATDPIFIAYLVSVAIDSITLRGIEIILQHHGDKLEVTQLTQEIMAKRRRSYDLTATMRGELAMLLSTVEYFRRVGPQALDTHFEFQKEKESLLKRLFSRRMSPQEWNTAMDVNGLLILNQMRRTLSAIKRPNHEANRELVQLKQEAENDHDPKHFLSALLTPVYPQCVEKKAQIAAKAAVVAAGARVLEHRLAKGTFPASLTKLGSPELIDPFDGKPLRYRREGNGFVVYSVGKTGSFEGGAPNQKIDASESLFRYPATPK